MGWVALFVAFDVFFLFSFARRRALFVLFVLTVFFDLSFLRRELVSFSFLSFRCVSTPAFVLLFFLRSVMCVDLFLKRAMLFYKFHDLDYFLRLSSRFVRFICVCFGD